MALILIPHSPDERLVVPVGELAPLSCDEERPPLEGDSFVEGGERRSHVRVRQERLNVQPPEGGSSIARLGRCVAIQQVAGVKLKSVCA